MTDTVKPTPSTASADDSSRFSKLGALVRQVQASGVSPTDVIDVPPGSALHLAQVQLTRATRTSTETHATVSNSLLNQRGAVQGGVYSVIADATAGWATEAFLGNDSYTTTGLTSQLVGVAVEGDVLVTHAHVVHGGRRTVVVSAEVYRRRAGSSDRLVALVTCQQLVLGACELPLEP
jgi:acyl-coenzyme A thioesterase PaaI-like protein